MNSIPAVVAFVPIKRDTVAAARTVRLAVAPAGAIRRAVAGRPAQ